MHGTPPLHPYVYTLRALTRPQYYAFIVTARWLAVWLDTTALTLLAAAAFGSVALRSTLNAGVCCVHPVRTIDDAALRLLLRSQLLLQSHTPPAILDHCTYTHVHARTCV